ncbi:SPFH domain-containing protein [Enterobacteriaceae endosymbiont of Plateumaris rustica]|uniref:SPFH domain-containing protein n=1 Tax=Enterobacteriaceae endosymbiont of Plateumaris rustica TaxID=2675796 RepID=UPI0014490BE6|nr:SPFH domain-containing protein [Enterobacteriaceae endosymbiont of Plateumaris rustica]QJC29031.1 hypothetical protein GJT82_00890 [Enterobacteriaceae endosymbiont of Plateumaris rustica]
MCKYLIYLLIIILNFLYLSIFIINEGYIGVYFNNDKNHNIIKIYKPGLYFQVPFLNQIKILNSGLFNTNFQIQKFILKNKIDLVIKSYVMWKIVDYKQYFLKTNGNLIQTEIYIKKYFSDKLQLKLDKLNIKKVLNNNHDFSVKNLSNCENNNFKENFVSKLFFQNDNNKIFIKNLLNLGIDIIDVRIKKIILSKNMLKSIINRISYELKFIIYNEKNKTKKIVKEIKNKINNKNIKISNKFKHKSCL